MIVDLLEKDPKFEVAVAIGSFNNAEYLEDDGEARSRSECFGGGAGAIRFEIRRLRSIPACSAGTRPAQMSTFHGRSAPPAAKDLTLAGHGDQL